MMSPRHLAAVLLVAAAPLVPAASTSAATVALASDAPVKAQLVAGSRVAAIADRLVASLVTDPDRTVTPAFTVPDAEVPAGRLAITTGTPQVNPTYIAVPLQISVDGRIARTIVAGYRVQQYVHTAIAAHDLAPGAILTKDDLTMARELSTGRPGVDVGALAGRRLRAGANNGAEIFVEQTSIVDLVKSGAGVILVVHDGPVSLVADVIARTNGGLGETVTVYNARTNKVLSGTVTGPNRVELELPGEDE
jgi:flagella basal body P-ring formation protein FlgA